MKLENVKVGDHVLITAKGDFFAYVDGWQGRVAGVNNGLVVVVCQRVDGEKTLFVPAEELALSVA